VNQTDVVGQTGSRASLRLREDTRDEREDFSPQNSQIYAETESSSSAPICVFSGQGTFCRSISYNQNGRLWFRANSRQFAVNRAKKEKLYYDWIKLIPVDMAGGDARRKIPTPRPKIGTIRSDSGQFRPKKRKEKLPSFFDLDLNHGFSHFFNL
jgi:hypothetical protein